MTTAVPELLTSDEAARALRVSKCTLLRYVREGYLPHFRLPGGGLRFEPEDIDGFKRGRRSEVRNGQ